MFGIGLVTNALKTLALNIAALGETAREINEGIRSKLSMDEPPPPVLESNGKGRKIVHASSKE